MAKSPMRGVQETIQNAKSTGNGDALAIPSSFNNHKLIIKTSAGVSAGAIQPENADSVGYTGTWGQIGGGPITVPAASSTITYEFSGRFSALRARISTDIVGGTITVIYEGS